MAQTEMRGCDHCGRKDLAWHRVTNARRGMEGAYFKPQAWLLYEQMRDPRGEVYRNGNGKAVADTARPHDCPGYTPLRLWMAGAVAERPAGYVPKVRKPRSDRSNGNHSSHDVQTQDQNDANDDEPESDGQEDAEDMMPTPTPKALPHGTDPRSAVADAIAALVAQTPAGLDEDKVRAIVAEAIAAAQLPRTVEHEHRVIVRRPDGTEARSEGHIHPNFHILSRYIANRRHVYVYGPAGSSKTTSAIAAANLAGLRHAVIALSQTTTASQLFGFIDANSQYRPTILRDLYENGGVLILDEFDNCHPNVAVLLNGMLENGTGSFPDGMVTRSADFVVIANGNTNLRGATRDHGARSSLDVATIARFAFVYWPYDEALEAKIVRDVDAENEAAILGWVRSVRSILTRDKVVMTLAGPREAKNIALDLTQGFTFEQAAEAWVWRGLDTQTRERILREAPYPPHVVRSQEAA